MATIKQWAKHSRSLEGAGEPMEFDEVFETELKDVRDRRSQQAGAPVGFPGYRGAADNR